MAINRAIAARPGPIIPFIAETGGLNGMFVDTTALREQVIDDVILSAFGSRGPALLGPALALRLPNDDRRQPDRGPEGRAGGPGGG